MNIFQFYHDFYLAFSLVKISLKHGIRLHFSFSFETWIYDILRSGSFSIILGDPGADSGGEGKSKQAGKYGTREK